MRAFIGIDLDNEIKKDILGLQQELRTHSLRGRWKHSDNFHLTLKFLDEISPQQKRQIDEAMEALSSGFKPFSLSLSDLGIFPGRDAVRVLWLGLTGDLKQLQALYEGIGRKLQPIGFPQDKRSYSPHITLGQDIVFKNGFDEVRQAVQAAGCISPCVFTVNRLYLFKSEQIMNRRVYTKVTEYTLR